MSPRPRPVGSGLDEPLIHARADLSVRGFALPASHRTAFTSAASFGRTVYGIRVPGGLRRRGRLFFTFSRFARDRLWGSSVLTGPSVGGFPLFDQVLDVFRDGQSIGHAPTSIFRVSCSEKTRMIFCCVD